MVEIQQVRKNVFRLSNSNFLVVEIKVGQVTGTKMDTILLFVFAFLLRTKCLPDFVWKKSGNV